ncbi:MAG: tetratricopeptide repeat protein [Luteitalea sp.]|nr:tetratricopeptide repeat protein [Luteitalea sp.]
MRRLAVLVLVGALAASAACAPRTIAVPVVTTPRFPEFIQPTIPTELAGSDAAVAHTRSWAFLQAGDLKNAEREVAIALRLSSSFYPADASAGYIDLAQKDLPAALSHFARALERDPAYVPALVGQGQTFLALNRDEDAVAAFEAAIARDNSLIDVQRQVEVLRFRGLERNLSAARDAAREGRSDEAVAAYRAALASSPDSAFLYRELGAIERQRGELAAALEHLRRALDLDPTDASTLTEIGDVLEAQGDLTGALASYEQALAIDPSASIAGRRDALSARAELARLPEDYRAIGAAPQLTRGALAALIGVRLRPVLEGRQRDVGVITDVRAHWAEPWILPVVGTGVMEAFANHTFQPGAVVRRVDLAQAVSRLLARLAATTSAGASDWQNARGRFPDMTAGHVAYPAASAAVASGVMLPAADGSFQPSRAVTGEEAIAAIERLQSLANLPVRRAIERR